MSNLLRILLRSSLMGITAILLIGCASKGTDDVEGEPDDTTPPATVSDLRVAATTPTSITLQWTAPGDDDTSGYAMSYDLRGSYETITEANFASAVQITVDHQPLPPGVTEEIDLNDLDPEQTYYFALKTADDAGNVSGMSNCAHATCPAEQIIQIPDPVLQQLVRDAVGRPTGDLRLSDMLKLIDIGGNDMEIGSVSGLEYATNLRIVNLLGNHITDLTPLVNLPNLEGLNITGNGLTDVSVLSSLTGLLQLGIGQNQLTDISVVSNMPHLRSLSIHQNPQLTDLTPIDDLDSLTEINIDGLGLTDLSPISSKVTLEVISANSNQITGIPELASLPNLRAVFLMFCQVTDLSPLLDNTDFADGDRLAIRFNPLSETAINEQIPALEARGVIVDY